MSSKETTNMINSIKVSYKFIRALKLTFYQIAMFKDFVSSKVCKEKVIQDLTRAPTLIST